MSRIGKKPIPIEAGAKVTVSDRQIVVEAGDKRLAFTHRPEVRVRVEEDLVLVERVDNSRTAKAMHGLTRALVANMVEGVTKGFQKELEIVGVGWNAAVEGKTIKLNVGFADTKHVTFPDGVEVQVKQNRITISSPDKQLVGQVAAEIRDQKPPEPYNGKGIKYSDEQIIRKQGKAFVGSGS